MPLNARCSCFYSLGSLHIWPYDSCRCICHGTVMYFLCIKIDRCAEDLICHSYLWCICAICKELYIMHRMSYGKTNRTSNSKTNGVWSGINSDCTMQALDLRGFPLPGELMGSYIFCNDPNAFWKKVIHRPISKFDDRVIIKRCDLLSS